MRTIVYVDGYNLYHGRLKHTPFKWLDLRGLMASILRIQDPASELVAVKFFTANIKARFARRGIDSVIAQNAYHRALRIGVILPRPPELQARRSRTLDDLAHWTRDHILDAELEANQFPRRVHTGKRPADKPEHW